VPNKWVDEKHSSGLSIDGFDIVVHYHPDYPGQMFATCHKLGASKLPLRSKDLQSAKKEALLVLAQYLERRARLVPRLKQLAAEE
jgi:hypothetical protein